jgi:hypothetical protein
MPQQVASNARSYACVAAKIVRRDQAFSNESDSTFCRTVRSSAKDAVVLQSATELGASEIKRELR